MKYYTALSQYNSDKWYQKIVPELGCIQYAGNIGVISIGPGWEYGYQNSWETYVLLGYLPKEVMFNDYFCLTLQEKYNPLMFSIKSKYAISPLIISLSANTLFSGEFWYREPGEKYYGFSTKLRFHAGLGGRFDIRLSNLSGNRDRLSVYYDFTTHDLALLSYFRNSSIHLHDIISLGIGLQYKFF